MRITRPSPRPRSGAPVVWFINQYAGSPLHGMEFRHYELGRELAALGMSVVVVSGSYSHLYATQPRVTGAYTLEDVDGLTYCWLKVPRYGRAISLGRILNMVLFMLRLYRLPTHRLPTPDTIVVSSPSLFPILPAQRLARRFGSRLIFEVRDVWPLTLQELGGLSRWHPLVVVMRWFETRAYRVSDIVVSVFPAAEEHYRAQGMQPAKLRVIPNGVSPDALLVPTAPAPSKVRVAASKHPFIVGFAGTLALANSIDNLLMAARLLADDDIGIVIVGQGSEEDRLRQLAAGLPNVTFVGAVAKADMPSTLREFDICYIGYHRSPLYRFGISSNKVFDYMAASRPIVLAAESANDWVGAADCGATVAPDDPDALADAIRALRRLSDGERARLGANGRAYVEREHTYRGLAQAYFEVLEGDQP